MCKEVPKFVTENAAFIIPKNLFQNTEDIFASHEVGAWKSRGGGPRFYEIKGSGNEMQHKECQARKHGEDTIYVKNIGNKKNGATEVKINSLESIVKIKRRYSELVSEPVYRRSVYIFEDLQGNQMGNSIVHYYFVGGNIVPIKMTAHGNAKNRQKLYTQTQKSTISTMKEKLQDKAPRHVYASASAAAAETASSSMSTEIRSLQILYDVN